MYSKRFAVSDGGPFKDSCKFHPRTPWSFRRVVSAFQHIFLCSQIYRDGAKTGMKPEFRRPRFPRHDGRHRLWWSFE